MVLTALIDLLTSGFSHCFHRKSKAEWMAQAEYTQHIPTCKDEAMEIIISDSRLHSAWGGTV